MNNLSNFLIRLFSDERFFAIIPLDKNISGKLAYGVMFKYGRYF